MYGGNGDVGVFQEVANSPRLRICVVICRGWPISVCRQLFLFGLNWKNFFIGLTVDLGLYLIRQENATMSFLFHNFANYNAI